MVLSEQMNTSASGPVFGEIKLDIQQYILDIQMKCIFLLCVVLELHPQVLIAFKRRKNLREDRFWKQLFPRGIAKNVYVPKLKTVSR